MRLLFSVFVAGLFLARSVYCVSVLPAQGLHVGTGSTATLSCLAEPGKEGESVTWLKGDTRSPVPVAGLNDSHISTTQNNFTISNFHYSKHGGPYLCAIEGPSGHTRLSCPVHLQHARIMANTTSSFITQVKQVLENSTVALVCEAPLSWPPAEFYWEKDGERVDHEGDGRFWLLPSGNLYIVGVTVEDEGLYMCAAVNPVTQARRHCRVQYQLSVNIDPPMNETTPTFTVRPSDTVAVVGGQALIECSGHAHRLEWIIIHGTHFPREGSVLPTGALRFNPVTIDDAGVYRCLLSNSAGREHVDIMVEVKEPPSLLNTPEPVMELPLALALGLVGSSNATTVNSLTCAANGSPPLELLLMHDGSVISSGTVTNNIERVSLTHTVTQDGFYQCFATNDFGCEQWTTFVTLDAHVSTESVTEVLASTSERSLTMDESATSPLNGHTERPLDELTPETPTASAERITTTQTSTSDEPSSTAAAGPFTESSEKPTPDRTGDSMTTRVLSTSSDVTSTPTQPPLTTPPVLDVLTNGDSFEALVGSEVTFECEVRGGGDGTQLTWHFNNQPLPGVEIEVKEDGNGGRVIVSQLKFDEVRLSHEGVYKCQAHSPLRDETVSAPITLTVTRVLRPPVELTLSAGERGGLLVSWQPNPLNDDLPVGYKLAWDQAAHVTQTAVVSISPEATQYLIKGVDLSLEYTVLVWAYNFKSDGMSANATWKPRSSVTIPPTIAGEMSTTATDRQPGACVATEMGPTQILLEWPVEVGGVNITASCLNSHTSSVVPVTMTTHTHILDQLLPNCHYSIRVGGSNCSVVTPPGDVDLSATFHRLDNGSIQVGWSLPRELRGSSDLTVEVNVNGDWIPIHSPGNTPHIPMHLEKDIEHRVQFQFQSGEWMGFAVIIIPSLESPTTVSMATPEGEGFHLSEYGLIYGVIFGVLVVACASVVVVILVLKYIQMSRRESDKVTDNREKHREEFRRMSLERSSVKSLKKEPIGNIYHPKETDV